MENTQVTALNSSIMKIGEALNKGAGGGDADAGGGSAGGSAGGEAGGSTGGTYDADVKDKTP